MDKFLTHEDLKNLAISNVYESSTRNINEVSVSRCFIELEGGFIFELAYVDADSNEQIEFIEKLKDLCEIFSFSEAYKPGGIIGKHIRSVVCSQYWPSIGILVEDNQLVYCSDYGAPFRVGPLLGRLGEFYKESDLMDYWTKAQL